MSNLVSSDRSNSERLFYERPAATWPEALPLGNGRINTEMNYWPAETTNLSECHEPLPRYIDHLAQAGVYPNLLCARPPFQIDGNFGATAGIAELLLQRVRPSAGAGRRVSSS